MEYTYGQLVADFPIVAINLLVNVSLPVQRASTVSLCPRSLCVRQCAKVLRLYAQFFLEISDPPGRLLITTQLCYSAGLSPRTGQETIHQSR